MKRLLIFLLLATAPFCVLKPVPGGESAAVFVVPDDEENFWHTVEAGQTVYALSQMYGVMPEAIYRLNPDSREGIRVGERLKIPQTSGSYFYHTIHAKETLYSVSRMYQMKGEDIVGANPGLSVETFLAGKVIRIPTNRVTEPMTGPSEEVIRQSTNELLIRRPASVRLDPVRVALLLPLAGNARMVEYYEGFLLALEDMKKQGISVDIQVYDIGSGIDRLPGLFKKPEMQTIHLLVGGLTDRQIRAMADFSRERNVPYVIPFSSPGGELMMYPTVYQVRMPQAYEYSGAAAAFVDKYRGASIVFHVSSAPGNRSDFVEGLQQELATKNIPYRTMESDEVSATAVLSFLSEERNTVFVPSDDGAEALSKLIVPLRSALDAHPQMKVSLFGYPAWQVSGAEYMNDLFRFNATFYSVYYADMVSAKFKSFYNRYIHWYAKDMIHTYPKFGLLGYDVGMFFVQSLSRFGTGWAVNVDRVDYAGIQMNFDFRRINNWSGFINTNLYFIDFSANGAITPYAVQ